MAVPQPNIAFGLPGILRNDPDFLPAYVANYILGGGGFASRLTREVREKRGLTYDISTDLTDLRRAGAIEGLVATRADAVKQTVDTVRDTMAKFAEQGPTVQELDDAKTYLTGSYPRAFASNAGTASQLAAFQRAGLDVGYVARAQRHDRRGHACRRAPRRQTPVRSQASHRRRGRDGEGEIIAAASV